MPFDTGIQSRGKTGSGLKDRIRGAIPGRIAHLGAGLILWFTLAGMGAAASERTFDLFDMESARAWRACNGSPAVSYQTGTPSGLLLPCIFEDGKDRVYWDRAVTLDLKGYDLLELDLTCTKPNTIRTFGCYLKSGDGWYLWLTPLKEHGRRKLLLPLSAAAVEGRPGGLDAVSTVRLSCTKGNGSPGTVLIHGMRARQTSLMIVQGTLSLANTAERDYARNRTRLISNLLRDQGITHCIINDEAVISGRLQTASFAILPYNSLPPEKELRALASFIRKGGKLMVFYSAEPELAKLMGLKLGAYRKAAASGQWSSFAFNQSAPPFTPQVVRQESSNILPAYPADQGSRIIANWRDRDGKNLADPAWVQSPHGLWMSHVLLDDDAPRKRRMLLALVSAYLPSIREQAACHAVANTGKVGPFNNLNEAITGLTRMARGTTAEESADNLLKECRATYNSMSAAMEQRNYNAVIEAGQRLESKLVEAFARVQAPKQDEFRGVWDHRGTGIYPGNWTKTARILADKGINAVFANVLWAGLALYKSAIVPQSPIVGSYGDQLKESTDAAHANGLELHAWKVCWNLGLAPESFAASMRKAGRTQVSSDGSELQWLCPSHPDNIALELKTISEMVDHYPVDGVHLDYVRYPDNNACFCEGCRRRFSRWLGEKVNDWPASARSGRWEGKYDAWRSEQITAFVRAAHDLVRKHNAARSRQVRLSAAVYPQYPGCISSIGQDWGRWLKEGTVDFVCPMNYTQDNQAFKTMLAGQLALPNAARRVFPGLGVTAAESQLTPDQVIEQIRQARLAGAEGFVLFDLNPTLEDDVLPFLRMGITRPNEAR